MNALRIFQSQGDDALFCVYLSFVVNAYAHILRKQFACLHSTKDALHFSILLLFMYSHFLDVYWCTRYLKKEWWFKNRFHRTCWQLFLLKIYLLNQKISCTSIWVWIKHENFMTLLDWDNLYKPWIEFKSQGSKILNCLFIRDDRYFQ